MRFYFLWGSNGDRGKYVRPPYGFNLIELNSSGRVFRSSRYRSTTSTLVWVSCFTSATNLQAYPSHISGRSSGRRKCMRNYVGTAHLWRSARDMLAFFMQSRVCLHRAKINCTAMRIDRSHTTFSVGVVYTALLALPPPSGTPTRCC